MTNMRNSSTHKEHIRSHICTIHCISWTAIIMGAIVAISLSFLLNLLGLAIGLTAYPTTATGQTAFAISGFVGLVIFGILTMFPAGWIAGFLGRAYCLRRRTGELYGLGTWGLALILTIILASHFGQFLAQANYIINRNVMNVKITDAVNTVAYTEEKKPTTTTNVKVNPKEASQAVGAATFVTFFVFFIGLLSCCLGGRSGMIYQRRAILSNCPECK